MAKDQAQDFGALDFKDQSAVLAELQARSQGLALLIPEYDPDHPQPYPGGIKPGRYTRNELASLLREQRGNPDAIEFIADMLEE